MLLLPWAAILNLIIPLPIEALKKAEFPQLSIGEYVPVPGASVTGVAGYHDHCT